MKQFTRDEIAAYLNTTRPSMLLRIAVADFRRALRLPNVVPWMRAYVRQWRDGTCGVCLAGACLYLRLDMRAVPGEMIGFDEIPDFAGKIDMMRKGHVPGPSPAKDAVRRRFMHIVQETYRTDRDGGRALLSTYLKAAKYLESKGL